MFNFFYYSLLLTTNYTYKINNAFCSRRKKCANNKLVSYTHIFRFFVQKKVRARRCCTRQAFSCARARTHFFTHCLTTTTTTTRRDAARWRQYKMKQLKNICSSLQRAKTTHTYVFIFYTTSSFFAQDIYFIHSRTYYIHARAIEFRNTNLYENNKKKKQTIKCCYSLQLFCLVNSIQKQCVFVR